MSSAAPHTRSRMPLAGLGEYTPSGRFVLFVSAGVTLWAVATVAALTSIPAFPPAAPPRVSAAHGAARSVAPTSSAASGVRLTVSRPAFEEAPGALESPPLDNPSEAPAEVPMAPPPPPPAPEAAAPPHVFQIIGEGGLVTAGPRGGPLNTHGADLYDCADFVSFEQMLAVFISSGLNDPNHLDPTGSGSPCAF